MFLLKIHPDVSFYFFLFVFIKNSSRHKLLREKTGKKKKVISFSNSKCCNGHLRIVMKNVVRARVAMGLGYPGY